MKVSSRSATGFANLRKTLKGLREVASGEVMAAVIKRAGRYIQGRAKGELKRHVKTGLALKTARVETSDASLDLTLQRYRKYIKWSFAKGFPLSALNRIRKMFDEEFQKAVQK